MHSRLIKILAEKKQEVIRLKKSGLPACEAFPEMVIRDFKGALSVRGGISLIAEIKFASPSAGVIRQISDPLEIGKIYEKSGAAAISLLTDKLFFGGDLKNLMPLKKKTSLPILRKDFIIDDIQVEESYVSGADAILLIARILSKDQLKVLLSRARESGMAVLTEIHDRNDLEKAVDCGADIIGINNRNLDTFEVNINTTNELAPLVPDDCILVSESGIMDGKDIQMLGNSGISAVLVGTSIMKSDNPAGKVNELVMAGK